MASIRLTPDGKNSRGHTAYKATYSIAGKDLIKKPLIDSRELMKPRPGIRGYIPRGVDRRSS